MKHILTYILMTVEMHIKSIQRPVQSSVPFSLSAVHLRSPPPEHFCWVLPFFT